MYWELRTYGTQAYSGGATRGAGGRGGVHGTQWLPLPSERCTWKVLGSGRSRPS